MTPFKFFGRIKKTRIVSKSIYLAMVGFLSLPLTSPAQIEKVVVTAQKREKSLQEVSVAITAFNARERVEYGFTDLRVLAQQRSRPAFYSARKLIVPGGVSA